MADGAFKASAGLGPEDEPVALAYIGWPTGQTPIPERPGPHVTIIGN